MFNHVLVLQRDRVCANTHILRKRKRPVR